MKLRKPYRILLPFAIISLLFIAYIHTSKDKIVSSAVLDKTNNAVAVNVQNPFIVPITIYHSKVVDKEEKEMPATAYSIILNGSYGSSPAHPCAWSRIQMGFASPVNVTSNLTHQAIASVESGGSIYRLWTAGLSSAQYYLVENRQRTGYDAGLPSDGLLIWHIDDAKTDNDEEWWPGVTSTHHFLVALEQADGLYQIDHATSQGDAADPFPGTTANTSFSSGTSPSSNSYSGSGTLVAVANISNSAATMYADLIVGIAAGVDVDFPELPIEFELAQNYPNPFNPGTSIQFSLSRAEHAQIELYNVLGQHVKTLLDGVIEAGSHTVEWDGTDRDGQNTASGIYFYRLTVGNQEQTKKMLLIR